MIFGESFEMPPNQTQSGTYIKSNRPYSGMRVYCYANCTMAAPWRGELHASWTARTGARGDRLMLTYNSLITIAQGNLRTLGTL